MPDSIVVSWNKVDEWTVKIFDDDGNILLWHKRYVQAISEVTGVRRPS